jgi:hypothetical protein
VEAGILAIIASIFNCIYMAMKNRSQDAKVDNLTKKVNELEEEVDECHKERSVLSDALEKWLKSGPE